MIVEDFQVAHRQSSLRLVEVDFYGVASHWDHPENVAPVNSYVVIMDLLSYRQGVRSNWNGIEVKSDKTESTVMLVPVRADDSAVVTENSVRAGNAKISSACRHSLPEKLIEATIQ